MNFTSIIQSLSVFGAALQTATTAISTYKQSLASSTNSVSNNGGSANINLDGLSQFTSKFEQFIGQLKSINPVINMQGTHTVVVEFGASAGVFKGMEEGLQRFVVGQVNIALSNVNHTLMNSTEGSIGHVEHLA
jgi:hypothetical protein